MNLTRIDDSNAEFFTGLIPDFDNSAGQYLGIIEDDGLPSTAALLVPNNNTVELEWIYVHPDFRKQGRASRIVRDAAAIIKGNYDMLTATFYEDEEGIAEFLQKNGFFISQGNRIGSIPINKLLSLKKVQKLMEFRKKEKATPIVRLTKAQKLSLKEFVNKHMTNYELFSNYDEEISYVTLSEEEDIGTCLFATAIDNKNVMVNLFLSHMDKIGIGILLADFIGGLKKKGYEECTLKFVIGNQSIEKLLDELIEDAKISNTDRIKVGYMAL